MTKFQNHTHIRIKRIGINIIKFAKNKNLLAQFRIFLFIREEVCIYQAGNYSAVFELNIQQFLAS